MSLSSCQTAIRRAITPGDRLGPPGRERRQRLPQIPYRNAPQIENRPQGVEATRLRRLFRLDVRTEPDLRRCRRIGGGVPNLLTLNDDWSDPGQDEPFLASLVPDNALPAIRQTLMVKNLDETIGLSLQRGRQHVLCAFPRNLRQRVRNDVRLAPRDDRVIVFA